MKLCLFGALILMVAAPALAQDKGKRRPKPGAALKKVTKDIGAALRAGDAAAVESVCTRALGMKDNYESAKMVPVAKALAKGASHKDDAIAIKSIETVGALGIPGTAKFLGKLLAPPAKIPDGRLARHLAALRAASAIHDVASLKQFEKLLVHPVADIADTAALAFSRYKSLETKPKNALVKKLVVALAKLEKARDTAPDDRKADLTKVIASLNESLAALTGQKLSTAVDWTKWIKERAKA